MLSEKAKMARRESYRKYEKFISYYNRYGKYKKPKTNGKHRMKEFNQQIDQIH